MYNENVYQAVINGHLPSNSCYISMSASMLYLLSLFTVWSQTAETVEPNRDKLCIRFWRVTVSGRGQTVETSQRRVLEKTSRSGDIRAAASSTEEDEPLRRDPRGRQGRLG